MEKRVLTENEKQAIFRVSEMLSDARRHQLLADMANAVAESMTGGSRVVFSIAGYDRPQYRGQHSFGVAGKLKDKDGAEIAFDLYADENDRLLELELIRWAPGKLDPDWSSLELF
jgi:hypothetical protein